MNSVHFAFTFALSVASIAATFASEPAAPKSARQDPKPVIVLVHGAFADATGWQHVIPLLEKDGYTVSKPATARSSRIRQVAVEVIEQAAKTTAQ